MAFEQLMAESMKKQEKKKDKDKHHYFHHGHPADTGAEPSSSGKYSWYDPSPLADSMRGNEVRSQSGALAEHGV